MHDGLEKATLAEVHALCGAGRCGIYFFYLLGPICDEDKQIQGKKKGSQLNYAVLFD